MSILIVGGKKGKESGIVRKISESIEAISIEDNTVRTINGFPDNTPDINTIPLADLLIWMPNIPNEEPKKYPFKNKGSVLICSKLMREGYTNFDAVARIFEMHGNAVIAIYPCKDGKKYFKLIDALSNLWYEGEDIDRLVIAILGIYIKTKETRRAKSYGILLPNLKLSPEKEQEVKKFKEIYQTLAKDIQTSCGNRFFWKYIYKMSTSISKY